ncbi:hypothetical protein IC614_07685 [Allosphingosinicella flava]|uniref:Lipoprotein n=1 Tax=Allosphingosinicella flava TaxID=2771430 RepID=A0A7T2GI13_9SPHN|nr:hypothetical protein [Sphingosinicella flava]QPQ54245.1 hypothetical protein IC614_07685 [Sphingosinicella flava]
MKKRFRIASLAVMAAMLGACASSPKSIDAAYVSPGTYKDYACDDILVERAAIEQRADALYGSLKKRATADKAKMAAGAVLFLPALLFLKGDGMKAQEFAELKGRYKALSFESERKQCGLDFLDIDKRRPSLKEARKAAADDI